MSSRFGPEAQAVQIGKERVVRGILYKMMDENRVLIRFSLNLDKAACEFEFYSRLSTKPLAFGIEEIEDPESFDVKATVSKLRLIDPADLPLEGQGSSLAFDD